MASGTGVFHHVGTFLLFAAAILLLITCITSPVVNDMGIAKVTLTNTTNGDNSVVSFGTFGYCILHASGNQDFCTGDHVGYNPAAIISATDQTTFSSASTDTMKALTRVMILHPIACGLAFIAFLLALGAGFIGSLFAALVAFVTWIITVVVMACDFALFGILKNHVNDSSRDSSGSHAKYSTGMWTCLAAMVVLFLGTIVIFFTCCSKRIHERRNRVSKHGDAGYANGAPRRRFWNRY